MPRRPRKQPRFSNGVAGAKKSPGRVQNSDAKMKKWVRREDIEGDDEDNFQAARDRILLEGDDAAAGDGSDDGEEEVFGLGLEDDYSADEAEEEDGENRLVAVDNNEDDDHVPHKRKKTKKSAPQPKSSSSDSDSEESESWGRKKSAYYSSNAALLSGKEGEEDEEEANEMEEREARRLQARLRDDMEDGDYGLDDETEGAAQDANLEVDWPADASNSSAVLPAPGVHLDKAAALRHLEKTSPETLALAREWDDVAHDLVRVQGRLDKLESTTPDALSLGLSHLHHQTLLTYVTTLAFYLHLRAAQTSQTQPPARLKAVLARLLTLKQAVATMEDLDFDTSDDGEDEWDSDASDLDEEGLMELRRLMGQGNHNLEEDMANVWGKGRKRLEDGELEALLKDADAEVENLERPKKRARRGKDGMASHKSHAVLNGVKAQNLASEVVFDLAEPEFVPTTRSAMRAVNGGLEAYGEVTALSMADDADKKARKRTLRFHTSKIESSARRKEEARERIGGDDDIPYRERKKEKEARIRREVEKTRGEGGDDLDPEGDVYMGDANALTSGKRKVIDEEALDEQEREDGYYELVKRAKQEKKESKQRQYEDARMAKRLDIVADEDASGPRSLTREILKNKGLTPRRSKSVRNPRVKKRERFEKAKKKVRSQKAVFKGGLAGKPYGGEESGITKVVKSIKL